MAARDLTRFVILTSPRSGSTWLVDALNGHPDVVAFGEAFQPGRVRPFRFGATTVLPYLPYRRQRGHAVWPPATVAYLRELYAAGSGSRAVGFKLMYGHARAHPLATLELCRLRVRVVHLVRENAVDVALSRLVSAAQGKGGAHATSEGQGDAAPVRLAPGRLVAEVAAHERATRLARRALRGLRVAHLELTYDALFDDPAGELGRVLAFLGVGMPAEALGSPLRKLASGGQGARVANFDEVRRAVTAAGYGRYLR